MKGVWINNGKKTQPKYESLFASNASSTVFEIESAKYPKLAIKAEKYNHMSHISFLRTSAQ